MAIIVKYKKNRITKTNGITAWREDRTFSVEVNRMDRAMGCACIREEFYSYMGVRHG
ncbi:hypothetical protein Paz_04 [Xylella phage Paz]|uniref:Uncharacterized protein n=1 Tax=Xylella phage Paz TaxID=1415145 RepID=V5Q8I5_9CAUD|nr:hypothetical protein Paz_04 [Xylella phage Paz]AHB12101.1 hypothetical protein Paz_04 [Xylella phage Paz]